MGVGFSDADRRKIAELKRLLPLFEFGKATSADRKTAGRYLHGSSRTMLKHGRRH